MGKADNGKTTFTNLEAYQNHKIMRPNWQVDLCRGQPRLAGHIEYDPVPRSCDEPTFQSPARVVPPAKTLLHNEFILIRMLEN